MSDLHWLTAADAARAIAAREISPVELITALLERIGRLDPKLHVFIRLDGDAAPPFDLDQRQHPAPRLR